VLQSLEKSVIEERVFRADGREVMLETVRSPLRDERGKLIGILAIGRDVTARSKAEEAVRRAKEIAEDATRMKTDFLANMSHEIRTPMNAIIGMSHLALKTDMTPRSATTLRKSRSGQHLLGVIDDILDFSKSRAASSTSSTSPSSLDDVQRNLSDRHRRQSSAKGLELLFDIAPEVPTRLVGDPLRVGQILINYTNNAVKYTEQGDRRLPRACCNAMTAMCSCAFRSPTPASA
jgi:two-component system sensor histidine kinase/response regulator